MSRLPGLPSVAFGWYYFVRTAASNRKIVSSAAEIQAFKKLLSASLARAEAHLHFAHVDGTEAHLVVRAGPGSLNKALGSFCHRYARAVNQLRKETGSVFRPHARVQIVQRESWLLQLGRYIRWLPELRSRECHQAMCWWNTDVLYRQRESARGVTTALTFRTLARKSPAMHAQNQSYRTFFDQRPGRHEIELIKHGSPEDARILGDPAFVVGIFQQLGLPSPRRATRSRHTLQDVRRAIEAMIEGFRLSCDDRLTGRRAHNWTRLVTLENVCSKRRSQPLPMIRALCASYVIAKGIATVREVEMAFCCRPGTLAAGRRRQYENRFRDLFAQPYEQLVAQRDENAHLSFSEEGCGETICRARQAPQSTRPGSGRAGWNVPTEIRSNQ